MKKGRLSFETASFSGYLNLTGFRNLSGLIVATTNRQNLP